MDKTSQEMESNKKLKDCLVSVKLLHNQIDDGETENG